MPSSACDWSSDVCSSDRSEEHTSELQSRSDLVCRLLLEKKKKNIYIPKLRLILLQNSILGSSDHLGCREIFQCFAPRPCASRSISAFWLTNFATSTPTVR